VIQEDPKARPSKSEHCLVSASSAELKKTEWCHALLEMGSVSKRWCRYDQQSVTRRYFRYDHHLSDKLSKREGRVRSTGIFIIQVYEIDNHPLFNLTNKPFSELEQVVSKKPFSHGN
jgi:hypothetical protein